MLHFNLDSAQNQGWIFWAYLSLTDKLDLMLLVIGTSKIRILQLSSEHLNFKKETFPPGIYIVTHCIILYSAYT